MDKVNIFGVWISVVPVEGVSKHSARDESAFDLIKKINFTCSIPDHSAGRVSRQIFSIEGTMHFAALKWRPTCFHIKWST